MKIAPKLMKCRVNMTYFVLNHDNLFNYFNRKMKNSHGNIAFLAIVKFVTHTLQNRLHLEGYFYIFIF